MSEEEITLKLRFTATLERLNLSDSLNQESVKLFNLLIDIIEGKLK